MNYEEFRDFRIADFHRLFRSGELTPSALTTAFLDRIRQTDDRLNAFLLVNEEEALREASELDHASLDDTLPSLFGIPVAVKDNICTRGIPTTCGSKILADFRPPYNATVVDRLRRSGAILLGKTNLDQFAMGSSTENSAFGPTRNPFDPERVSGGSSGGSAASVAAFQVPLALGSDTGGSVRQPAAFCGVVGLRPTYGRISRYGLISFASSLDQIGPIARNVEDAAILFEALSGEDRQDSTCAPYPPFSCREIPPAETVRNVTIGVPREYFTSGLEKPVADVIRHTLDRLDREGFRLQEISLPHTDYALEAYYIVAPAEASSNLARYGGVLYGYRSANVQGLLDLYCKTRSEGFGLEVKRRIMLGTYSLSSGYYDEFYLKGMQVRTLVRRDFEKAFEQCDVLLSPVTPGVPFRIGEKVVDPYQMYLTDVYTVPSAMAGIASLSLNCGYVEGLPVGMQVMTAPFREGVLFGFSRWLEAFLDLPTPWPGRFGREEAH
ncbi:MAG TPA: Asp-tRNA(Asn)/Glu-tRNA(Gln) amidotransferase subunit GatA [Atribacteraceae bacterium]|nr:Asp-tRNA(Asn)/Glu-tRNA(Gln) amidotransferase subunit GatA [Atribacteraceae bacterium]